MSFGNKINTLHVSANDGPSSGGAQHFKGNASHVLHAGCLVWATLVLKIVKIDLLKSMRISIS
jgi:hypothetical protein